MKPYLLASIFVLGSIGAAAASGPAGSTGAEATVPGNIVRWQTGEPVPPQEGILSLIFAPPVPPAPPPHREPKVRKQ